MRGSLKYHHRAIHIGILNMENIKHLKVNLNNENIMCTTHN